MSSLLPLLSRRAVAVPRRIRFPINQITTSKQSPSLSFYTTSSLRLNLSNVTITKSTPGQTTSPPTAEQPPSTDSSQPNNNNNHTSEDESITITPSCASRILQLTSQKSTPHHLRVFVDAGGCSGFQYKFELEDESCVEDEFDKTFESHEGAKIVIDEDSYKLLKGCKIDYVQEMIKSAFVVAENPQSENACGCGSSFAVKNFEVNPAID